MRDKTKSLGPKAPPRRKPKQLAKMMDERHSPISTPGFDQKKSERATRQANQAADRLLREMDAFLKQTRKI